MPAASKVLIFVLSLAELGFRYPSGLPSSPEQNGGLRLVVTINRLKPCRGDAEVFTEVLDLATRYTNDGNMPKTIYIGTDVPTAIFVAKTTEDLKAAKYDAAIHFDVFPADGEDRLLGQHPKAERRIVLPAGHSVRGKTATAVPVRKRKSPLIPGTISPGKYWIVIQMLIKSSDPAAHRDKPSGDDPFRWVAVPADPIPFVVPRQTTLQDCSEIR